MLPQKKDVSPSGFHINKLKQTKEIHQINSERKKLGQFLVLIYKKRRINKISTQPVGGLYLSGVGPLSETSSSRVLHSVFAVSRTTCIHIYRYLSD